MICSHLAKDLLNWNQGTFVIYVVVFQEFSYLFSRISDLQSIFLYNLWVFKVWDLFVFDHLFVVFLGTLHYCSIGLAIFSLIFIELNIFIPS